MTDARAPHVPARDGRPARRVAQGTGRVALAAGVGLAAWTAAVAAAGRVDLRAVGVDLVAGSPRPSAVAALLLLAGAILLRRAAAADDLRRLLAGLSRAAPWLAVGLALLVSGLAVRFGAFVAGGSDSYCYVEQAERIAAGTLRTPLVAGFDTPWENAALSFTPTGFVPSRVVAGAIAPICPAGLALAMAAPRALGAPRESVFYVVPLLAGVAVWAAFAVGRRLAGPGPGLAAAVLTAASPVFLYQAFQPMSDVPATAWWLTALAAAGRRTRLVWIGAGLAAGLAVMMRPNLAPLVLAFAAFALVRAGDDRGGAAAALGRVTAFGVGLLPAVVAVASMQHVVYGSALRSGYGSLEALFSLAHVGPNLERYLPWLVETQSPFVLCGLLTPVVLWWTAPRREACVATLVAAFAIGVALAYVAYVPFDDWWFLRFWLPAIPAALALAAALPRAILGGAAGPSRERGRWTTAAAATLPAAAAIAVIALAGWQLGVARDRGVFTLAEGERKFVAAGEYVRRALPADAVVLTIWHSGAVRYYGERPALVWDAIVPGELPRVLDALARQGREPFLLLEDWERDGFRARFAGQPLAALDWPPRARVGRTVSIWAVGDRERFLRGEVVRSDRVW